MIVKGKPLADEILVNLKKTLQNNSQPTLGIILSGNNPASRIYINHKIKAASEVNIQVLVKEYQSDQFEAAKKQIIRWNQDQNVNGIIVQLPLYTDWSVDELIYSVSPTKDVDGFRQDSIFVPATALAVWEMLSEFSKIEGFDNTDSFLKNKNVVILGKGRTAGKPVRDLLTYKGIITTLIDSRTENPDQLLKSADLIISATGVKHIINDTNTKIGVFIIGIGVGKEVIDGKEKLYGDINLASLENKAKLICPTIGGIGPLTVACLLKNVVHSQEISSAHKLEL